MKHSNSAFYLLFASHFILVIGGGFADIKIGMFSLIITLSVVSLMLMRNIYENINWKSSRNGMLLLYSIWLAFCIAEIINPNNVQEAWNISITQYAVYPIVCALLVPVFIKKTSNIEWLLIIWSVFILIFAMKGYWQKNHGFNAHELYFLYVLGGAKTHIIWSGIRFFSFFSDATNFGVHMAMGITGLGISLFYVKNIWLKIYLAIVIIAGIYGMGISGTRGAIAIPLGGLALFILLSYHWKNFVLGLLMFLSIFIFFRYSSIGEGNQYVSRMRTAFTPTEDASYQLRIVNRKKIKEYMADKPFGYGIGLGGKAERFEPKELLPLPPDSWLVSVWTDTGVVGLSLYLILHGILFAWCAWILRFKIMNKQLRGLLMAWLCVNAGFFVSTYTNDVMQYPNSIVVYTGFALCFAGPHIDKRIAKKKKDEFLEL
ncbi:O-antigen ligase family protein [Bacteroides ihuae]|uniref:O-antigen ligase family protein n=1 Tax=Bacteroides ihuae TaxID=1852362 RepID=UPI0008DAF92F|nr:O-antigen ligase family protein [Bacteroides ihuae]